MSYVGIPPFGQTIRSITEQVATASQTVFTVVGGYLPGYIDIEINGQPLRQSDFTATNGTTVTMSVACSANDEVTFTAYWPVSLVDTYRKSEADTLLAAKQPLNSELTAISASGNAMFKNRIINGAMAVNQRASSSYTSNGYTLDRWTVYNSGGTFALSQQSYAQGSQPSQGIKNFVRIVRSSPSGILYFTQKIEDVALYDNITATVSFYAKATGAVTLPTRLVQEFGSGGSTAVTVGSVNHSVTTTLTKFTATYSVPSLAGKTIGSSSYLELTFDIPATTETLEISGVQLEKGSTATSFDYRPYGTELALCQRYYETSDGVQGFSAGSAGFTSNTYYNTAYYKVTKRTAPTLGLKKNDGTVDQCQLFKSATEYTGSSPVIEINTTHGFSGRFSNATVTDAGIVRFQWTASAEL